MIHEAAEPAEAPEDRPPAFARLVAAAATFAFLLVGVMVAGHRASWFPRAPVYRLPKWTPLELGMVDEEIARARRRADGKPYAILIGDSIPHGDGYGRPSESLAARLNDVLPVANLTSPSLAYDPEKTLLRYSLRHTDAPLILVQINLKWVAHEWTPEKFSTLLSQISDRDAPAATTIRQEAAAVRRRLIDDLVLREARDKLRYRVSNFTLRTFLGNGLTGGAGSLWATETAQENSPTYVITDLRKLPAEEARTAAQYHRLRPRNIDESAPLNALIDELRASPGRVAALVTPLNPVWTKVLAPDVDPTEAQRHLEDRVRSAGIDVVTVSLAESDYHDDMHLTTAGARKAAEQIAAYVRRRWR